MESNLAKIARLEDQPFAALNTAFMHDIAFLHIPSGIIVDQPIHIQWAAGTPQGKRFAIHPRLLVIAEAGCQASIVEHFPSGDEESHFTNAITEIAVGANASIDHYKVQKESKNAFHIAGTWVRQERDSRFSTHYLGLGGKLVRNEVRVAFEGEGSEATVNGLYLASGSQHMDNFTVIDHAKPHCASHELFKGILAGKAHGVFNGKIFVRQDAQKTDAKQTNKTLLLSDDAVINTKPQLEIYADDVKCTHGATVGQLDDNQVFYLRSRGIDERSARSLLTFAFANDIISKIKIESLRTEMEEYLLEAQHLPEDPKLEERA